MSITYVMHSYTDLSFLYVVFLQFISTRWPKSVVPICMDKFLHFHFTAKMLNGDDVIVFGEQITSKCFQNWKYT